MIEIKIPEKVNTIISILNGAGHEAYAVGGCIRDSLLNRDPYDWDITTSANPIQIKELFTKTVDTGIIHGTVTVLFGKDSYEVTTFRVDGEYEDHRHPKEVTFTKSLEEDLKRRDFTINAMAYNEKTGLIDLFGGIEDLKNKKIRCVGNPLERFQEDALRMMRAIRFAAQLGYYIEESTWEAICILCKDIQNVSGERIRIELLKTLESPNPGMFGLYYKGGLSRYFLSEFDVAMDTPQKNPHHLYSVGKHTLQALKYSKNNKIIRLALLFHDLGKPFCAYVDDLGITHFPEHEKISKDIAVKTMKLLKFDNDTLRKVSKLVEFHDFKVKPDEYNVRKAITITGKEIFDLLADFAYADLMAQSAFCREEKLKHLEKILTIYYKIIDRGDCLSLKEMQIKGQDLIEMGMKPGKQIGDLLEELLEEVLRTPELNQKNILFDMAREKMNAIRRAESK